MTHPPPGRGGRAGDEADHGLLVAGLDEELGAVFLGAAADFADHDDRLGGVVGEEQRQRIDEIRAVDRIAADADAGRLAKAGRRGLGHCLVSEGARARDDADLTGLMDVARHDADLAFARRDDAGAVGADQAGARAAQRALDLDHVEHGPAFGDADDEGNGGVDRFEDGIGGKGRRHINHACIRVGRFGGVLDRVEDGETEMGGAALARGHAADHARAVSDRLFGMERALRAGEALADDAGAVIDENRHGLCGNHHAAPFTAATAFLAASSRSSAETMARPDSASSSLPRATLVPSSRTINGTAIWVSRAAAMMPSAMMSQRMIPPKMLTRTALTFGSERMIPNAAVTRSLSAPPPTSRKLAGSPP